MPPSKNLPLSGTQTHLILYQLDTFERALNEYTRYLFFIEDSGSNLSRPLKDIALKVLMPLRPFEIEELATKYAHITRFTILHVDHLRVDALLTLLERFSGTLKRLELFCSQSTAQKYSLDDRLLEFVQNDLPNLTHLCLPFSPEDMQQIPVRQNQSSTVKVQRKVDYFANKVFPRRRPEETEVAEGVEEEEEVQRNSQALRTIHHIKLYSLGKLIVSSEAEAKDKADRLSLVLNGFLITDNLQFMGLDKLCSWSTLTALDLDLPPHVSLATFFTLISKPSSPNPSHSLEGFLPALTSLRLSDRQKFGRPRSFGHLFADIFRSDVVSREGLENKGLCQLTKVRSLTLHGFYFGPMAPLYNGPPLNEGEEEVPEAFQELPIGYHTELEIILPFLAPNTTSLHFEDCELAFPVKFFYRIFVFNFPHLRTVLKDNVAVLSLPKGGPKALASHGPREFAARQTKAIYALSSGGFWQTRADFSRLHSLARADSEVVQLNKQLWTPEELVSFLFIF